MQLRKSLHHRHFDAMFGVRCFVFIWWKKEKLCFSKENEKKSIKRKSNGKRKKYGAKKKYVCGWKVGRWLLRNWLKCVLFERQIEILIVILPSFSLIFLVLFTIDKFTLFSLSRFSKAYEINKYFQSFRVQYLCPIFFTCLPIMNSWTLNSFLLMFCSSKRIDLFRSTKMY